MKPHKYNIATKERRTDTNGTTYHSRAEMLYADQLKLDPDIAWVLRQVPVWLTPDDKTVVDFLVCTTYTSSSPVIRITHEVQAHEVKGMETRQFKRIKKLWKKYGKFPLRVVKRKGAKFITSEVIDSEGETA